MITKTKCHDVDASNGILNQLMDHHKKQLELCTRLEELADSLPDNVDKQECLSISWQIYPTVRAAHKFEEEMLFPLLSGVTSSEEAVSQSLERLKFEHWEDESSAEDISLTLRQMISEPAGANVEKVSYMLRGFFDGLRRHIAFESEHLLPLLNKQEAIN
ncbi:MAG: hemerythrin domain-containing protein [Pseudomonadota bacterium]